MFWPKVKFQTCGDGLLRPDQGCFPTPVAKTAAYTLNAKTDSGKVFTNTGASGSVTITLPSPAATYPPKAGMIFRFWVTAAQTLVITASGGAKINAGSANGSITAAGTQIDVGSATLTFNGTNWLAATAGTWS